MIAVGRAVRMAVLAASVACLASATAQTIYKCKAADGRISYSSMPCAPDAAAPGTGADRAAGGPQAPLRAAVAPPTTLPPSADPALAPAQPVYRSPLPKECDNAASLRHVVARLDSPSTPHDIRDFLAAERFRLLRCEYMRFTSDERRQRDAAMRDLDARDAARRMAAVARIEALYDRYLTPNERAARARAR